MLQRLISKPVAGAWPHAAGGDAALLWSLGMFPLLIGLIIALMVRPAAGCRAGGDGCRGACSGAARG
jgi:hypothetical protein